MEKTNIPFNKFYKRFNILSLFLILISIILLTFKGLNYGVDFKGGTLLEIRAHNNVSISDLRSSFNKMNLEMKLSFLFNNKFTTQNQKYTLPHPLGISFILVSSF